jgi:predicted PurR-regulated permease PerM
MAPPHRGVTMSERRPATGPPTRRPTPIPVSRTVRNLIILAVAAVLALIVWAVPVVIVVSLGGFAVALVLSFPVQLFSRAVPRSLAILLAFLILLAVLLLASYVLVPLLVAQVGALVGALPGLVQNLEHYLVRVLEALDRRDLLPSSPEDIAARLGADLRSSLGVITGNVLGGTLGLVFGTFSFALTLFAVVFVAASLLANVRSFKAAYLTSVPAAYRRDARELWDALALALSRYLGGLAFVLFVQGALSALALYLIGVPYALALGAWVSITAVIPFLGAWLGAVPALLVAFSISPTAVVLTALVFLAIQQLEGNILTPRIQGQTIGVPSVIVFLAVIVGGALGGIMGVLFAVPTLAVLRVLFDFFRVRLRTAEGR